MEMPSNKRQTTFHSEARREATMRDNIKTLCRVCLSNKVCLSIQQCRKHIIALPYDTWIVSTKMQMLYNLGLQFVHYFTLLP